MKFVLDTNTLISGFLWTGSPAQVLRTIEAGQADLVMTPALLNEFEEVVVRPQFARRLLLIGRTPEAILAQLRAAYVPVEPAILSTSPANLRDPDDAMVLQCAESARVDAIVTGDKDLLELREFNGIPILTATETLKRFGL